MYLTILRLLWPYLGRYVANYAADFLGQRRARRLQAAVEPEAAAGCPPCPPCPPEETAATENSTHNTLWYTASGLVLGGAFGLIAYIFIRDSRPQPS